MVKDHQSAWDLVDPDKSQLPDRNMYLSSGTRILQKLMFGLLPSCVQRRFRPVSSKQQKLHPTSYLDGLRGVSSFIVFMGHYTEENLGWWTEPYGMYEDGAPSSPMQLPWIRTIYSARPMVHIFFIISGYVLAYKPIKQIHSQQYSSLAGTLSSSVFRRAIRLFLPSIITLLIMALAVYSGISDERYAGRYFELSEQLNDWWYASWDLLSQSWAISDIYSSTPWYNPALWTIPVEFAQSMILFVVLIGLSRCISHLRLLLLAGIMWFCFHGGQLYTVEFLGGMFLAEVTLLHDASLFTPASSPTVLPKFFDEKQDSTVDCISSMKQKFIQAFWIANVLCGLFIASWTNEHAEEVWGISWLQAHTPEPYEGQRVWFCLGAFQIVVACTQLKFLQRLFNTGIAQYLGNISYALYLTHNLCLTALEPRVGPIIDAQFGKGTFWGRHLSWAAGLVIYLPIILWVADVFWRAIDTPTVKFARWLEGKCIVEKMS